MTVYSFAVDVGSDLRGEISNKLAADIKRTTKSAPLQHQSRFLAASFSSIYPQGRTQELNSHSTQHV